MDSTTAMMITSLAIKGMELFMQMSEVVAADLTDEQVQAIAKQTDVLTDRLMARVEEIKKRQAATAG